MTTSTTGIRVRAFGGPEVLQVESGIPLPALGDEDVLIRSEAAGVNPVDTYIRQVIIYSNVNSDKRRPYSTY